MELREKIFADFHNADKLGRIRLNTNGSLRDIKEKIIVLVKGLEIIVTDNDELEAEGVIEFSNEEKTWVAKINWDEIRHL